MKLTLGQGTPVEAEHGYVDTDGPCVRLMQIIPSANPKDRVKSQDNVLVVAYHLKPGETVRRTSEGDYDVQF